MKDPCSGVNVVFFWSLNKKFLECFYLAKYVWIGLKNYYDIREAKCKIQNACFTRVGIMSKL